MSDDHAPQTTARQDLVVTRVFAAPIEEVWQAWSDPEYVMQWWGPVGFTSPSAQMDVRVGGTSLVCMRASEAYGGQDHYSTWAYQRVVPLERIDYIHNLAHPDGSRADPVQMGMPPDFPQDQLHSVTFKAVGERETELTVTEYNWPVGPMMEMSKLGLDQCLDKMAAIFAPSASTSLKGSGMTDTPAQSGYAAVNGLNMYYEIHGTGDQPLVLLHGAYMSIDSAFGELIPTLAANRQVIAVELQGHGRTADIDRPLSYEQMADDVAALLNELGLASADLFGYSMGAAAALQVTIRHPQRVRKLIAASVTYNSDGMFPELLSMFDTITPEMFAGTPMEAEYKRLAPNPDDFPRLVTRLAALDQQIQDWPAEDIQSIKAPTMLIIGDSDIVRPEHALAMFHLLGGGVCGDLSGLPTARLAVLPGTMHQTVIDQTDLLLAMIPPFLDAPMPDAT